MSNRVSGRCCKQVGGIERSMLGLVPLSYSSPIACNLDTMEVGELSAYKMARRSDSEDVNCERLIDR